MMASPDQSHQHAHAFVDLFDSETVSASIETIHRVSTLRFHERGISMQFTEAEAQDLRAALEAIAAHLNATPAE
jgi:hypothetical protein